MRLVICQYCGKRAELITGKTLFPHLENLHGKWFWRCESCKAHVGCHQKTTVPMGTLAKVELRALRSKVHKVFDQKWQRKRKSRGSRKARHAAYKWLADQLNINPTQCHIGLFDEEMCRNALEVINNE